MVRLQTQNLAAGVTTRFQAEASASPSARSKAWASSIISSVAAVLSKAESASTLSISGWSASSRPKAMRWRA